MGFIGDIFGKGGDDYSPPPMPQMPDYSDQMMGMVGMMQEMMGGIMHGMQGQMASIMENAAQQQESLIAQMNMSMPDIPDAYRDPEVDWGERQDQLSQKAKADYHAGLMRRKSALDTVLTSPLLDEEDPELGGSVLAGD